MKTKSLILTAMLGTTVTLSAQDAPAEVVPATEATPAAPAAEATPARLKLADIDPAVRAYGMEAVALALEAFATYLETTDPAKFQEEPDHKVLVTLAMNVLEKNSTEGLPAPIKGFMDEFIVLAKQASAELMLIAAGDDEALEAVLAKYDAPLMAIAQKYPEAVALGIQIFYSMENLGLELGLEPVFAAFFADMMTPNEDPVKIKKLASTFREAATEIRAKKLKN